MTDSSGTRGSLCFFSLLLLLVIVILTYANRIADLDLWWHLTSGQTVLNEFSLPETDPFSYTTGTTIPLTEQELQAAGVTRRPSPFKHWDVSLSHSWLGQVIFYFVYSGGGLAGIGFFKALVFALIFFILFLAMRKKGAGPLSSLFILLLVVIIGYDFDYSRPQIFSFLSLSLLFYLFADFKHGGKKILILPGLFFIWQNLHGGFVLGAILLLLFWCTEVGKFLLNKKFQIFNKSVAPAESVKRLSYWAAVSYLLMIFNPNHYKIFLLPFGIKNSLFGTIEEYARPMLYEYHAYWFMLALVLIFFVLFMLRNDITDLVILLFLAITSQMGIRGIFLFAIGASPFLATSLTSFWFQLRRLRLLENFFNQSLFKHLFSEKSLLGVFLLCLILFGANSFQERGFLNFTTDEDIYPGEAVTFLKSKNYPGNLFNHYNWGGYLIWKYPEKKVFIDGRCLDENAFFQYQLIMNAQGGQKDLSTNNDPALWKKLLNEYRINVVLTNAVNLKGQVLPLVDQLIFDRDWSLVYQDGTSLVFLRDTPAHRQKYGRDYLPKLQRVYDEIISESEKGLLKYPATWGYYELLGFAYMNRRELGKARTMFEKYLTMNPNNRRIIENLNVIRSFSGEAPLNVPKGGSPHNW